MVENQVDNVLDSPRSKTLLPTKHRFLLKAMGKIFKR
jgi:hypothetical protein